MVNTMTLVRQRVVEAATGATLTPFFPAAPVVVYRFKGSDELQDVPLGLATPAPALADNSAQQVVVIEHDFDVVWSPTWCVSFVFEFNYVLSG